MTANQSAPSRGSGADRLRAPTMADVAALAGVSPQTVSRVLRGHPNVSELTRTQVEVAVQQTGYRRTGLARALVTGRSMTIGVVNHESANYSSLVMMLGMQRAARENGYFLSAAGTTSVAPVSLTDAIEHLRNQGIDGLVVALPIWDEAALHRAASGLPTVIVDAVDATADSIIAVDQEAAGRLATEHLLELGHETVWHVGGPESWKDAGRRTIGWASALQAAGRVEQPVLHGDWSPESGYRNGKILARMDDVTAIFVSSDEMAFGVMRALIEHGKRIPEDVSVVGMDDIALAKFAPPPLTTVRQPFEEMGRRAVERLVRLLDEHDGHHEMIPIMPELIVRESTGPAPR